MSYEKTIPLMFIWYKSLRTYQNSSRSRLDFCELFTLKTAVQGSEVQGSGVIFA